MTVTVAMAKHYDTPVVAIYFDFDPQLNNAVRKIPFVRYSKTLGCWYVPFESDRLKHITDAFKGVAVVHAEELMALKKPAETIERNLQDYEELLLRRRYCSTTRVNYCCQFQKFLMYFNRDADTITEKDIVDYMHYLIGDKKVSASTQNIVINALKFYYEQVRGGERKMYSLQRPFMEEKLPTVFSEQEVRLITESCDNLKHKTMLQLIYAAGLRRSELLGLRLSHIDRDRNLILIVEGKGRKDRVTLLSQKILAHLDEYVARYTPKEWLFESPGGGQYSSSSLQQVFLFL